MDDSPVPGFITRRQASEICKRAERTLQRYWSRAIELGTTDVLDRLKLRTEDGRVIDGRDVTKDLIDQLKKQGKNPTWFVHEDWVQRTYGPRAEPESEPLKEQNTEQADQPQNKTDSIETVTIPRIILDGLHEELKVKNEQINQANERDRETHLLMRDLHKLLGDMQQRLPTSHPDLPDRVPEQQVSIPANSSSKLEQAVVITETQATNAEKGSAPSRTKAAQKSKPSSAGRTSPVKKRSSSKKKKQQEPHWYDMPTFRRWASHLTSR